MKIVFIREDGTVQAVLKAESLEHLPGRLRVLTKEVYILPDSAEVSAGQSVRNSRGAGVHDLTQPNDGDALGVN